MVRYECMKIALEIISNEIVQQYNLHGVASNGWVYMDIHKDMICLKQQTTLQITTSSSASPSLAMPSLPEPPPLWKHGTKDITFSLVVDNFGLQYGGKKNSDHLIQALKKLYTISVDWTGAL